MNGKDASAVIDVGNEWAQDFVEGKPFRQKAGKTVGIQLKSSSGAPVAFDGPNAWKINVANGVGVGHQLQIFWPGEYTDQQTNRGLAPDASEFLVRLQLHGHAQGKLFTGLPVGPLSATFGIAAGGMVAIERLKLFSRETSAPQVIQETLSGIRFPQQIETVKDIPEADEILVARFGGYLKLSSQLSYGYSMTQSQGGGITDLQPELEYKLKLAAGLSVGYQLAGEFEIEAHRGTLPNFIRLVVRKSRSSSTGVIADFGLTTNFGVKLPDSSEEFLAKIFGVHAESALALFGQAKEYASLDRFEKASGKILKNVFHSLSTELFGEPLSDGSFRNFLKRMKDVAKQYNDIDPRIIHLYEDHLSDLPALLSAIEKLAGVKTIDDLRAITDSFSLDILKRMMGGQIHEVFWEEVSIQDFIELMKQTKRFLVNEEMDTLRNVARFFPESIPVQSLLFRLSAVTDPQKIRDGKLLGLAEKILGRPLDDIPAKKIADRLRTAVNDIASFQEKYYSKLKEVANRSFQAHLQLAYSRSDEKTALLDVEIDLSTQEGIKLTQLATSGDFSSLLDQYNSRIVRIHQGMFTHSVAKSTQIQINLFGYQCEDFTQLLQNTEEAIEAHDGGLLHIYTTKTSIEERKKRGGELTASTFLIAATAKALQPEGVREYLIRTLPKMSIQYDLFHQDDDTQPDEMRQMLEFAEVAGIVHSPDGLLKQLMEEFPQGLGKVNAKYVIRYDSDAVLAAFCLPDHAELSVIIRRMMRSFIATRYVGMPVTNWSARLGFAYSSASLFDQYEKLGFAAFAKSPVTVNLPASHSKGTSQAVALLPEQKHTLASLYSIEDKFIHHYLKLCRSIRGLKDQQTGITVQKLNQQILNLVGLSDDLNEYRQNAFFAVLDHLIQTGNKGTIRNSSLVLEITPPQSTQTVTKIIPAFTHAVTS